MNLYVSCASGLQQVLKKELQILGYKPTILKSTLLNFQGDDFAIAQTNIRLRTANKVYLEIAQQKVQTFDELFDFVYAQDRAKYIGNSNFIVKASSNNSKLFSTPTIQSISEKAMHKKVESLKVKSYKVPETLKTLGTLQTGGTLEILILLENDICCILINTSGESLHKRGYKLSAGEAPINETLAAGLILLSAWKFHEPLYDIFCGSGTIPIEAAMIAKNIAPGLRRTFAFQNRKRFDELVLDKAKYEATDLGSEKRKIMTTKQHTIIGTDSDPEMIKIAQENAKKAGVENYIQFEIKKCKDYLEGDEIHGTLVSNPPYGQRMNPENLKELYQDISLIFEKNPKLSGGIITSYEQFQTFLHLKGENAIRKTTPFYNGGTPCLFFRKSLA